MTQVARTKRIFLGGPIQFALKPGGFDAKTKGLILSATETLESAGYEVISAHRYESFGLMDLTGKSNAITSRDYQWMAQADLFVALLPLNEQSQPIPSYGTCVELGWASALGKPIVVIRSEQYIYSHLIEGLPAITPTLILGLQDFENDSSLLLTAISRISLHQETRNDAVYTHPSNPVTIGGTPSRATINPNSKAEALAP